jgi:hypothetical protein
MKPVSRRDEGLRPATDAQITLTARLLSDLNARSFRHLRSLAAGTAPGPDPEALRRRLLGLIERFLVDGRISPEAIRAQVPARRAQQLGSDLQGEAGQETLRQIVTELAAVLLLEHWPRAFQDWFDRLRPTLLRRAPDIVPSILATVGAVRASDFMASWGLAISEEHASLLEPPLQIQREAVENGVRWLYDRLRANTPIDTIGLAAAALDDFEELSRGLEQIRGQVWSGG